MRIPKISGVIERRLLIDFRVDPQALVAILPAGEALYCAENVDTGGPSTLT